MLQYLHHKWKNTPLLVKENKYVAVTCNHVSRVKVLILGSGTCVALLMHEHLVPVHVSIMNEGEKRSLVENE